MNYLSVENLSKSYSHKTLFSNISFGIEKGQKVALVAKNGSGKSSLFNVLIQKDKPDAGKYSFRKGIQVGFLEQAPALNDNHSVLEAVLDSDNPVITAIRNYEQALLSENADVNSALEQMEFHKAWDYEAKVKQILGKLKIDKIDRKVGLLSGGQKKRIAMAQLLIEEPEFLILDEPTNHLDLEIIEWLEDYLDRSNMTLLMVTHDRYFLERICDEILELENGELYRHKGNYSYYLEKKAEREQNQAQSISKAKNLMVKELAWVRRQPQARGTKAKYRLDAFHELKKKATQKIDDTELELSVQTRRLGGKILELTNVQKAFGDLPIVNDFSYIFKKKERIGIVGKNGVGKTTFLNMLTGKESVDNGIVEKGETVTFGYYTQSGISFSEEAKVIDVIKDIAEYIPIDDKGNTISASQMLERFLFTPEVQYNIVSKLSGGERKRLYLLTILMENPNFLILDEPTNDLDIVTLNVLEDFLSLYQGCVMVVSHDRYFMDKLVDHLFVFEGNGEIRDFTGSYSYYFALEKEKEREQEQEQRRLEKEKKERESLQEKPTKKKHGLTYKENQELQSLEGIIDELERRKEEITVLLTTTTNTEELVKLSEEFSQVEEDLDEKTMRWLELEEIKTESDS